MAICSFCGRDIKLTREHIWSDTLLEKYQDIAPKTFDYARSIVHESDPVIKDLCEDCNGGTSDADAAIREFADRYFSGDFNNWDVIPFDDQLILRWAMKTASNMERASRRAMPWWKPFVPFFLDREEVPDLSRVDLLLAPWVDLTPDALKEHGGAELMGATVLAARTLAFYGLASVESDHVMANFEAAWALKVNNGVFGVIVWKNGHSAEVRSLAIEEARSFGWLKSTEDEKVGSNPYNTFTCNFFNLISPQNRFPGSDLIPKPESIIDRH